ncbi:MAG: GNAT family N-acetyltransferase [Candidatus Thorarchaeota archaeon]
MITIKKLEKTDYEKVRPLVKGLHYQLAVDALIDGTNPGWILVDNVENPQSAWIRSSEGFFLAGATSNAEFNNELRIWIEEYIAAGKPMYEGEFYLMFGIDSGEWKQVFSEFAPTRLPLVANRLHYLCSEVKVDWRSMLPEGYEVRPFDREILSLLGKNNPYHIDYFFVNTWGTFENFEKLGFGLCTVHGDQLVSYSLCDCISNKACEVGIQTIEDYRRRGFATITAAATVEYALSNGYSVVGWHTDNHNYGSIGTAEKVGFVKKREYEQYICMFSEAMHIAEAGMRLFYDEEYSQALELFEKSFHLGEVKDWAYYLAARICAKSDDFDNALKYLLRAAEVGCEYIDHLLNNEEFISLHSRAEWSEIIAQFELNAKDS